MHNWVIKLAFTTQDDMKYLLGCRYSELFILNLNNVSCLIRCFNKPILKARS